MRLEKIPFLFHIRLNLIGWEEKSELLLSNNLYFLISGKDILEEIDYLVSVLEHLWTQIVIATGLLYD